MFIYAYSLTFLSTCRVLVMSEVMMNHLIYSSQWLPPSHLLIEELGFHLESLWPQSISSDWRSSGLICLFTWCPYGAFSGGYIEGALRSPHKGNKHGHKSLSENWWNYMLGPGLPEQRLEQARMGLTWNWVPGCRPALILGCGSTWLSPLLLLWLQLEENIQNWRQSFELELINYFVFQNKSQHLLRVPFLFQVVIFIKYAWHFIHLYDIATKSVLKWSGISSGQSWF